VRAPTSPAATIAMTLIVMACASTTSPSPINSRPPSQPSTTTFAPPSPEPGGTAIASPSLAPPPASASLPVRGSAYEIGTRVLLAPGLDGTLFVAIPRRGGSVLASLDRRGRPRPGWPIKIQDTSACEHVLPVDDGSVRVVCDATDLSQPDNDLPDVRAFAFDANGRLMAGWPVQFRPAMSARIIDDHLSILAFHLLTDTTDIGLVSHEAWLMTVDSDGSIRNGTKVPMVESCCGQAWAIGPDGVAYGANHDWGDTPEAPKSSALLALDFDGPQAGFPVRVDGMLSRPAFDDSGLIHVTVNEGADRMSRTLVIDRDGQVVGGSKGALGISATDDCVGIEGTCEVPIAPFVGSDGTTFVIGAHFQATGVAAVTRSGRMVDGWPYRSSAGHQNAGRCSGGDICEGGPIATPVIGPDDAIYLINAAPSASVGGSVVAIGSDGRVRPGWPVELRRPGGEFWAVVVGTDGTAYALAVEPESSASASATVLAIGQGSTVTYSSTIIEP
jgi:hypothetical protein